jgi:hypothetical protein
MYVVDAPEKIVREAKVVLAGDAPAIAADRGGGVPGGRRAGWRDRRKCRQQREEWVRVEGGLGAWRGAALGGES